MLKVSIDLMPGGASEFRRSLATMTIVNVTELSDISDYEITATEAASVLTGQSGKVFWFKLNKHDRRQSVWKLVGSAIAALDRAECAEI